ncbi:hypothetical protein N7462_008334 [Penicillium macrosclerotiorum]|uniref:uncharacterized protein n=1 Tax=Penicillium macrosclerotiorum TaxID=303699 RepID=UPI00254907CF|nr:uncharacterized protein N7462_008334 [Penicillium macrosclerotiorum]KAJ5675437.1 hypothetical protein N7462_008334 [Penicillium macrosclerotiorum]
MNDLEEEWGTGRQGLTHTETCISRRGDFTSWQPSKPELSLHVETCMAGGGTFDVSDPARSAQTTGIKQRLMVSAPLLGYFNHLSLGKFSQFLPQGYFCSNILTHHRAILSSDKMTDSGSFIKVPNDEEEARMRKAAEESQQRREAAKKKREMEEAMKKAAESSQQRRKGGGS